MKIGMFLLAMILVSSLAFSVSVEKIFADDIQAMCENDSSGQLICLTGGNYEYNIPLVYTEDIECVGNSSTFIPDDMMTCYSKAKPLKIEKFNLDYNRKATPAEMSKTYNPLITITKTKTYFPNQEVNIIINPELLNHTKCVVEENISLPPDYYYFKCDYKGKKQDATILVTEKAFVVVDAKQGFSFNFTLENIIYIILGIIIIAIAYSIIRKPSNTRRKKRRK